MTSHTIPVFRRDHASRVGEMLREGFASEIRFGNQRLQCHADFSSRVAEQRRRTYASNGAMLKREAKTAKSSSTLFVGFLSFTDLAAIAIFVLADMMRTMAATFFFDCPAKDQRARSCSAESFPLFLSVVTSKETA
ncbi:hypothetical protein [Aestuariivirga sp.]|uniref:hypothetical protein n=1 Tax=Aestuariivirga sp. TaxID=2650926 RepID=UPI00378328AA